MDVLKDRYPHKVVCRKNFEVVIKPLTTDEIPKEIELFQQLDKKDQSKLPNDLNDSNYPHRMRRWMEDGRVITLAAWSEDQVVGVLSLYPGVSTWIQHTGEVVLVTHPKFRRYGIATVLFDEMIPLAETLGLVKLYADLMEEHKEAQTLLTAIGFVKEATLKDHIQDAYGRRHDLSIYSMDLDAAHRAMEDLMSHFQDYSG
jgi:RimJ/RimL family protein N-acetyltransferase